MTYLVEDTVKCDECGSRNLSKDESRGEVVCNDCGLILFGVDIQEGKVIMTVPTCVICQGKCENEWGNNPAPIIDMAYGVCCDFCNFKYVIPARLGRLSRAAAQDLIDREEEQE